MSNIFNLRYVIRKNPEPTDEEIRKTMTGIEGLDYNQAKTKLIDQTSPILQYQQPCGRWFDVHTVEEIRNPRS